MNVTIKFEPEDKAEEAIVEMIRASCGGEYIEREQSFYVQNPARGVAILKAVDSILRVRQEAL